MPSPDTAFVQGYGKTGGMLFHPILKGSGFLRQRNMGSLVSSLPGALLAIARG
jgi:hypothetical protein